MAKEETTTDLAVLATWERWRDCRGKEYRRNSPPTGEAVDQTGFLSRDKTRKGWTAWYHSRSVGEAPWTRVHVERKPAPATFQEAVVFAHKQEGVCRLMSAGWPHSQVSEHTSIIELPHKAIKRDDWLVFVGGEWVSPNGWVEMDDD